MKTIHIVGRRNHGKTTLLVELIGVYLPRDPPHDQKDDFYERLASMFTDCPLVLAEGHLDGPGLKIEVWRQAVGGSPLATERDDIVAIISDDPVSLPVPVWPRSDMMRLADSVLAIRR